ncbi:Cof-type HAD-IIB family hydrolase [Gracilibacillus sp. YIM 98692]|uniref:Cof-type HAD-IIB family hydrolase n=1 Tax=Gracilibacillus sp. YIM 98692 TaxID=2663532 RepID=UPI0013D57FC1|nr:Cof-type HAD-IIB family hydrolase [Gracilibacillus sp. YIM 98692]
MDKDIRLIALDMDGTLLNEQDEVTQACKDAIKKARDKGVEVIISTGRHYRTSAPVAKELDIHYLVTVNGSEVWTLSGELISRQHLDAAIVSKLVELKEKHQTWAWLASVDQVWRGEVPTDIDAHQWLKFGFDTDNHEVKEEIIRTIEEWGEVEWSNSSLTNIEVNALGVNKAAAIEIVADRLGLKMDQVMAVGDSLNDIKMIKKAGLGIAMGNAQDEVKKASNWVTASNREDGVAKAIEKWVL